MSETRIRSIVVAGGGADGWMTAAVLARVLSSQRYTIRLIDRPGPDAGLDSLDGGEAVLPPVRGLHGQLGIPEEALFEKADATASLGCEFVDWAGDGARYFHPFGEFGAPMDGVAFHHYWLWMRREKGAAALDDYALAAVAARLGRFAPPVGDPSSVLSTYAYAYHWDGAAHTRLLRASAEENGVERIEGDVVQVHLRDADGFIEAVTLDSGERIEADLFIDCSGARGVLIREALGVSFEDWSQWLACDRAAAVRCEGDGRETPYMRAQAHGAGWGWRIPLKNGLGRGLVYSSAFMGDDEADEALLASLDGPPVAEPRRASFANGRLATPWSRNCVAVGASACVLDPVAPTARHLAQKGVWTLLTLLPDRSCPAPVAEEYNRIMTETMERARDFVILRYKIARRTDSPFWSRCSAMPVPESLAYKMRLFESRGWVFLQDEETFSEADWVATWLGQGVFPRIYDPLTDTADPELVQRRLRGMQAAIRAAAEAMPTHRAYIDRHAG